MNIKTDAELIAMSPHSLLLYAKSLQERLATLELSLQAGNWGAIANDALTRGDTLLADAILAHARLIERLETIAVAAVGVYADYFYEAAWTALFEALSDAGRLPGDEEQSSAEVET